MKKLLYLFLVLPLIFSSCKKEEDDNTPTSVSGCMDPQAVNYNANATQDDCACLYDVTGVWETTSALLNGVEVFSGSWSKELFYFFGEEIISGGETGDLGFELYNLNGNMNSYGFGSTTLISEGPCVSTVFSWDGTVYESSGSYTTSGTINMDYITNVNNITWRYVDYPNVGDTYVKTLVRSSTYILSDWFSVSGCMDPQAVNYNPNATQDDCTCLYDITGVWETTSALLNGVEVFSGSWSKELIYYFGEEITSGGVTGDLGFELYDMNGSMNSYGFGSSNIISEAPCVGTLFSWDGTVYESIGSWAASITINMDYITNVNNITWRYVDYPNVGDTYVKTLVRSSTYILSDWK